MRPTSLAIWFVMAASCSRRAEERPARPKDAGHDDKSHVETHYYLAVTSTEFVPPTLLVPSGKQLILLVDPKSDTTCATLTIDTGMGPLIERPVAPGKLIEIHLVFPGSGDYEVSCGSSPLRGTIVAQ